MILCCHPFTNKAVIPFGPYTLDLMESGLVGSFQYHNQLDSFVLQPGSISAAGDEPRSTASDHPWVRSCVQAFRFRWAVERATGTSIAHQSVAVLITGLSISLMPRQTGAQQQLMS